MHPRVMEQEQGFTWTFQPRHQTVFEMYLANTILDFEQTVVHITITIQYRQCHVFVAV
jgi:hypothetical protein